MFPKVVIERNVNFPECSFFDTAFLFRSYLDVGGDIFSIFITNDYYWIDVDYYWIYIITNYILIIN